MFIPHEPVARLLRRLRVETQLASYANDLIDSRAGLELRVIPQQRNTSPALRTLRRSVRCGHAGVASCGLLVLLIYGFTDNLFVVPDLLCSSLGCCRWPP